MKNIKYRTWSKVAQQMVGWEELKPKFVKLLDNPEYPYMQFTGLLDKSGKEIYEGDIVVFVEQNCIDSRDCGKRLIVWYEAGFEWVDLKTRTTMSGWLICQSTASAYAIVIGNIYENPELLKEGE